MRWLDRLALTRLGHRPAFRVMGIAGLYIAFAVLLWLGLVTGRSVAVLAVLLAAGTVAPLLLILLGMRVRGTERLVQQHLVWAVLGAAATALVVLHQPVLPYLDLLAIALAGFLAVGRLGCLLVGCCYGHPSSIGIRYGEAHVREGFPAHLVGVRLLPVQAIEAAGLVVLGLAGAIALPFVPAGRILCWFLIAHGLLRMGLDSLRGDSRLELLGLSRVRWRAAWQILIGLWLADGARVDVGTFAVAAGAVSIVGCIALVQWRGDPRRRVMTDRHLMELRGLLAKIAAEVEDKAPVLRRSTLGVALAVSRGPPEFPGALHVSLSLPEAQENPRLLCEVAADLCPGLWPEHCCLSPACVLHLLVRTDRWIGSNTDHGLADDLYGVVLRRSQACRPRAAS